MRKSGSMKSRMMAAIAPIGVAAMIGGTGPGSLLAQQAEEAPFPGFSTYELFPEPDSVDPSPNVLQQLADAIRTAEVPNDCPLGRLRIRAPAGDPMFQEALAGARRDAVLAALQGLGVSVAGRLFVETEVIGGEGGHDAIYEAAQDDQPPTLNTTSVPANGSRVKPGDEIKITLVARDDAEPEDYQTGVKTLQLVADSEDGRFLASENYEPCAEPLEHRVEVTYTVPSDPPPVVRLSALTEDHGGLTETDLGEFPLGDWYGRIEWALHTFEDTSRRPNENRAETKYDGYADLSVDYDGQGNLTGTLIGSQKVDTFWWGYPHGSGEVCAGTAPDTPVSARVLGSYTPGTNVLSLHLVDVVATIDVPWSGGGPGLTCAGPIALDNGPTLSVLIGNLQPVGDGTYRSEFETIDATQAFRFSMTLKPTAAN